jgi:TRAP-type C4-dicarboxylate transport system permease small subunit
VESLAARTAALLAGLPELGRFLGIAFPALLAVAGALFAVRRTRVFRFMAHRLDALLGGLLAAELLAMVFLSSLQILLRNVFDSGLLWIDPLLRHLVLLLAFTGAVVATGSKRHVQINALGRLLRGRAQRVGGTVVAAAASLISLAIAHASLVLLLDEIEFSEIVFLNVPSWLVVAVFPVSFLVLAFRFGWLVFAEIAGEAPQSPESEMAGPAERAS